LVKDEIFQTDPLPNSEMKSAAAFIVSILLLAFCQSASAQPAQCPICRFEYRYGHCSETGINNPPKDSIAFTGTVTAAEPIDCGVRITVDVKRSSARSLPAKIAIDVLPCSFWNGAIGDGISAAGAIRAFPLRIQLFDLSARIIDRWVREVEHRLAALEPARKIRSWVLTSIL